MPRFVLTGIGTFVAAMGLMTLSAPGDPAPATGPQVGSPAPAFALTSLDGKRLTNATFAGKTLVLNVWATWCPPCRAEMPDLIDAEPGLAKNGVALLGVDTTEGAPIVRAYAVAKNVPYALALDPDKTFGAAYDIQYFPTTYVIDAHGIVRARYVDLLGTKELATLVDAAQRGENAEIVSPLQSKIDAVLAAAPTVYGTDPDAVETQAKTVSAAIDRAESLLDDSDAATGNATDFVRTRAEEAKVRDAAIAALVDVGTSVKDASLLPRLHGDAALDREAWHDAVVAYAAALAVAPGDEDALQGTALAAGRLHDHDAVVDADTKLAALEPANASDLVELARAQAADGNDDDARATFARAIALAIKNADAQSGKPPAVRALAYALLYAGRFNAAAGRTALARADYAATLVAAERLPASDDRHDMYVEESQEATVALGLTPHGADVVSIVPWTGADLPGSIPDTIKYRLVVAAPAGRNVVLRATGVPSRWVASFCSDRVCAPFQVGLTIPDGGVKVVEFQLVPPGPRSTVPKVRVTGTDGDREFSATT